MRPTRPVIAFDAVQLGERPDRAVRAGRARQVARGIYTTDLVAPLERVVRANVWEILARLVPDAQIADRSAGPALFAGDTLFVISSVRARDLQLPGLRVAVRPGQGPFDDDPLWMAGLRRSSIPRALVENLAPSRARSGIARTLTQRELEDWVAVLAQQYPADRLNRFRDRCTELAHNLGHTDRFGALDAMFAAALGTARSPRGGLLGALGQGRGWDTVRLARFAALAERLASGELDPEPSRLPIVASGMQREQPFFEAYLSNFIEGTEFTVDEAVAIVYANDPPIDRTADAHDVTSTYALIIDPDESSATAVTGPELVDQLKRRHARLMAARPDKRPGTFKEEANRFGSYDFVAPRLVRGTLERGLAYRDQLVLPFARAVYMMFLISEVHPFDDGNGRLARLAMNAELSAAGEARILLPLISRNDYLSGLRRLSRDGDAELLTRVLAATWRWSAQGDYADLDAARLMLAQTNALVDAADAEREGKHLLLPSELRG